MVLDVSDNIQDLGPQWLNNRYYWLGYGRSQRLDDDIVTMYRSGVGEPLLNGILRVGEGGFERARSLSASFDGLPYVWWVGGDSHPGLADDLLAAGATEVGSLPVMAARVEDVPMRPAVPGLTVERLAEDGLSDWVSAYAPSMAVAPDHVAASLEMEADHPEAPQHLTRFVGRVGDTVVGTGALLDRGGVGGIYLVSTAEPYRRRGIGSVLSAAATAEARSRGLKVVTLQATPPGEPLYRSMGFTTVSRYRLFTV